MKFAITLKEVPIKEILTSVEQGIAKLPSELKEELRADVLQCPQELKTTKNKQHFL